MKYIYIALIAVISLTITSCDDWLDVKGKTLIKEKDIYNKEQGFYDALTGCYMTMADLDAYGQRLTMSDIESLANLWYMDNEETLPAQYYLKHHDYEQDNSKGAIKSFYAKLFNIITQANALLKNIDEKGGNIRDSKARAVIEGEAYAIRAFCQFDVLRIFGQLPKGSTTEKMLPYSESSSIENIPSYYKYDDYVEKLKNDIQSALNLLKDNDPIFNYTFAQLNTPSTALDNDNDYYRQSRLNFWAVKALQARMYLYLGEKENAHATAMEIINAKDKKGNPVIELNSSADIDKGYLASPSESLFYLSKFNLLSYTESLLLGNGKEAHPSQQLIVSADMLTTLFSDVNRSAHNRYLKVWNRKAADIYQVSYASIKKYYYDLDNSSNALTKLQIIPMLRLSEQYLIAIETSTDLAEANELYKKYMLDHNIPLRDDTFTDFDQIEPILINEYRREFYAEGQMFYVYKRLNVGQMLWDTDDMTEEGYVLPLPETEYNPNAIK